MQIRYTAKRSLNTTDGHTADTEYTMNVKLASFDRNRKVYSSEVTSLSGYRQRTYQRGDDLYKVKTVPVTGAVARNFREFLDSVEDGTYFEVDFGGGFAQYDIDSKGYTERRVVVTGDPDSDYFEFGWTQRAFG